MCVHIFRLSLNETGLKQDVGSSVAHCFVIVQSNSTVLLISGSLAIHLSVFTIFDPLDLRREITGDRLSAKVFSRYTCSSLLRYS